MTARDSAERAAELAILVSRHSALPANVIARHVCHLQRIARQAKASATALCNVPGYQERHDHKVHRLRHHATCICLELGAGFRVELDGDPRGPCCWITIPGERGEPLSHDEKSYSVY